MAQAKVPKCPEAFSLAGAVHLCWVEIGSVLVALPNARLLAKIAGRSTHQPPHPE